MFATVSLARLFHSFYAKRWCAGISNAKSILISEVVWNICCLKNLTLDSRIQAAFSLNTSVINYCRLRSLTGTALSNFSKVS